MHCTHISGKTEDGKQFEAIICSRGRRKLCKCGRRSTLLCDFELTGPKKGKTCDAPLCSHCATSIGKNRDLCPVHAAMQKASTP